MRILSFIAIAAASSAIAACNLNSAPDKTAEATVVGHSETRVLRHPDWAKNATIYEVNMRQHTSEGTFAAFEADLDRLDSIGVDIIWIMPIHPIGVVNRKEGLGSYYSVRDYRAVNPEFGTMDDFKRLVNKAHSKGMKVIIDWVANHTAWDHAWMTQHPEWYTRDTAGNVIPPVADWSDVADLNYDNKDMQREMIESMKFWIKETDIDGFRCDVAMMVPTEFWDNSRAALDSIKPVFMLAEAEQKDHHLKAFDMSYAWEFKDLMAAVSKGDKPLSDIEVYMAKQDTLFPRSAYRMYFTTNHDENTWNGTGTERYGKARQVCDVLAMTLHGMPLLYSGQEGNEEYPDGRPHRLKFFEKDTVFYNGYNYQDFYTRLFKAHHDNPALWNGENGGSFQRINTSSDNIIFAYSRKKDENEVIVLLNFSDKPQKIDFTEDLPSGDFRSIFNSQTLSIFSKGDVKLPPFGYQVFVK